jgi:polyhydroxyalkanoate synthesis regulator phasin
MSKDLIMDAFKLGLGAVDLTREEAERIVASLQNKYKDEISDGRVMVDDLLQQAKTNTDKIQKRINAEVTRAIKEQDLVAKKDLDELRRSVEKLVAVSSRVASQAVKNATVKAKAKAKKATRKFTKNAVKRPKKRRR